jgi:hypothetical protein
MQHPYVFGGDDVNKHASIHVPDLDETWFECQNIRVEYREGIGIAFPCNDPVWSSTPSISVNKERVIRVAE